MKKNHSPYLKDLAYNSLLDLITEEGINASGKEEIYGCLFGRDSFITILKILKAHTQSPVPAFLPVIRATLQTHISLQGKEINLESGEEPGKFIHEFRKERFDHLLSLEKPWYVYPDGKLRNYDSLDSTPLALIAMYRYFEATNDLQFIMESMPAIEKGLNWIISYGDSDKDFLQEYKLPTERKHGGLVVQSWTDSHESIRQVDGIFPLYPIAPVEVQGYAWLAIKLWSDFYMDCHPVFANKLASYAKKMKKRFNEAFLYFQGDNLFPAQALDGNKKHITTITGNQLLLLFATYTKAGKKECILYKKHIPYLVERSFQPDMFDTHAGIRTMSTMSPTFNSKENSYHNGSFWPVLNGLAYEGLRKWGYKRKAKGLKEATLHPIVHFQSAIELYIKTEQGELVEFNNGSGQTGCRTQAWTAASILDLVTHE